MTNAELNLAIAKLVIPLEIHQELKMMGGYADNIGLYGLSDDRPFAVVNYCNNWNDLMPLVVEHCIELHYWNGKHEQGWFACYWDRKGYPRETEVISNPQRALAECLLKVLREKGNE